MDSEISPPVIPDHRWRGSPQIIDVDAPDVDDIVYVRSSPPRQRRRVAEDGRAVPVTRQVIHITDSDDDEEIQFVGSNPARPQHPRPVQRERIFSPPPPPQMDGIPPVPPIPQRFLPLRHRPLPGLVIANEVPFPFEADLGSASRPAGGPSTPTPPPVGAPPSRHLPFMGFGGALLAGVRQVMRPLSVADNEHPSRRNGLGLPGTIVMRWDPFDLFGAEGQDALDHSDGVAVWQDVDVPYPAGGVRHQLDRAFERRHNEHPSEPDYKPEYTHPNKPLPGFTHDFGPTLSSSPPPSVIVLDDSPSSSSASASGSQSSDAALVCASCRDPLILGASDIAEGRNQRRLWGLRCGHIFDGKCVEKLMKPFPPASDQTQTPSRVDQKGKGKMVPETLDPLPSLGQDDAEDVTMDVNSMRSRLRPRRGMPGSMPSISHPTQPLHTRHRGGIAARPQITHRSKGKGKGKAKAPFVEAEHAWSCPVSGCGQVHLSLLIDGQWTMDEKRGAIAVFV
ncbi:hypothetical protein PAXINDRAFT_100164 [Paxillus involutus ATCC 200175]|uniref:Uncharacterized protein n=1 Tax=Paxillus involutus ATCC 200175 TaxID=664439 RepID=A0A0C9SXH5_PAXIN|nr:hypothetical protein PAXINDRAFT_100164 [Paxillus involutus ATCC 200175]